MKVPWVVRPKALCWISIRNSIGFERFERFRKGNESFLIGGSRFENFLRPTAEDNPQIEGIKRALDMFSNFMYLSRLMTISRGYLGKVPNYTQLGDFIAVLYGCSDLLVLRFNNGYYKIIGSCYVYGIMYGEVMEMVRNNEKEPVEIKIL